MRRGRRSEPALTDPSTHPRRSVCLRVAAGYLEMNERTLRARIEEGCDLEVFRNGKVYRITVQSLVAYRDRCVSGDNVSRETA